MVTGIAANGGRRHPVKRILLISAICLLASGCSDDKPTVSDPETAAETLKRDCADAKCREQNLGLWYSLCRQPLRW
jgi:hypothetical protein